MVSCRASGFLLSAGRCNLTALPEGEWFCGQHCEALHNYLRVRPERRRVPSLSIHPLARVVAGMRYRCRSPQTKRARVRSLAPQDTVVGGPFPLSSLVADAAPSLSLQFMRGRRWGDPRACGRILDQALSILEDSFDPIEDVLSGQDLLPIMVGAETFDEHDYTGMYSVVLMDEGRPVSAATVRFFGQRLAEVPLVATAEKARRKGYAAVLMGALEATASRCGVEQLVLPVRAPPQPVSPVCSDPPPPCAAVPGCAVCFTLPVPLASLSPFNSPGRDGGGGHVGQQLWFPAHERGGAGSLGG